jgi:hypothetical protein
VLSRRPVCAGVEQRGLNEWAPPSMAPAGYEARPPPKPLSPAASAAEDALQACMLSLGAPEGSVAFCDGVAALVARLNARSLIVRPLQAAECVPVCVCASDRRLAQGRGALLLQGDGAQD